MIYHGVKMAIVLLMKFVLVVGSNLEMKIVQRNLQNNIEKNG